MARKRDEGYPQMDAAYQILHGLASYANDHTVAYTTEPLEELDDRVLIVIADKEHVVARSVERREADKLRASPSLALRLAEIEAAVEEARTAEPALVDLVNETEPTE